MTEGSQSNPLKDAFENFEGKFDAEGEQINLSEPQFLFANLLYKTDFKKSEIIEYLEFEPSTEEMDEIQQMLEIWRSNNQNNNSNLPETSTIII